MAAPAISNTSNTATARFAAQITPSDTTNIGETREIYIGGAGTIACEMAGDGAVVSHTVPDFYTLTIGARRVLSTGTTATLIVAHY